MSSGIRRSPRRCHLRAAVFDISSAGTASRLCPRAGALIHLSQEVATMNVRTIVCTCASLALALLAAPSSGGLLAQEGHGHAAAGQLDRGGALVKLVRESTERFKNVAAAERENYHLMFGCVSGPDYGAMGL